MTGPILNLKPHQIDLLNVHSDGTVNGAVLKQSSNQHVSKYKQNEPRDWLVLLDHKQVRYVLSDG